MKFSTKIFLLFSIFVLVIILPLGMFLHHVATKIILEQITQNLQKQADRGVDKIDWILFERTADIKILSNSVIKNYIYSPLELTKQLIYIRDTYKIYASLAFFDLHRVKIADITGKSLGEVAPDSIWTREVYEQGIASMAREVYFSPEFQQIMVVFATPVWGDDTLLGALVIEIPIKNLLAQIDINETTETHIDLIDHQGLLLYSNHDSQLLLQQVAKTDLHAHEKSVFTLATEKGYLDFPGNGWTLIFHYREDEVFKPLIESRNQLISYGLILLLIAILVVIFFAHRIIRPILSLKAAAQRLGQGHFDTQVLTRSKDEIGELAHAFNQTADLLKTQFTELKQFRTLVDIVMDNIFILNANTMHFVYINNSVINTMGYTLDEMMKMTPLDIDATQSIEQVGLTLEPLKTGKISVFRFETVHRRKNGRTYPVEISLQYIKVNEEHQYYIAIARDLSERKQAEQLILAYNQQLKQEIEAQTAELLAHTEALAERNQQLQQESEKRQQISITLRQKEEFLRLIIDNIPQLIFWKDINSVYLGCNQHTALINNFKHHDEIIGKTDYELAWSHCADKYRQDDQWIMKSDQAELHIIELYKTQDDEESWLETNKIPLHDADGSVVGILGTSEDITLRRKAEQFLKEYNQRLEEEIAAQTEELEAQNEELEAQNEELITQTEALEEKTHLLQQEVLQRQQIETALRRSEERFALAMEGANDGLWDWNLETGTIYYSKRWKGMLGFSDNELPNKPEVFFEQVHPDDKEPISQMFANYTSKQCTDYKLIVRLRHKDNHYRWILTRAVGVWNEAGKAVRLVGTHVDLTKQKQIEAALAESERRFRELHDGLRDGIVSVNLDGRIIQFNQSFRRILACYTEEEIYQLSYQDITPEKWHISEATILQEQVLTRRYSELYEKEYILKDGSVIPIEIQAYLMLDEQSNPSHIWKIIRDISERKQVERALQQAKETAEVANQAKSSFLANMSHELRTPLNGILGYTQILNRDATLTDKQREGIAIIQRSGEYLLTLINDILDLAKIEAGRIELYETNVHFEEFIQSIVQLFKVRAEQKGIAFFYERLSPLPAGIRTDEKRLRQILINLLGNAIKFTTDGGVSLKISYENHKVNFLVEDTGVGIASNELESIFHPFQQVGDQNQRAEGTGLGLSITQRLAEKMGGDLSVTSELRKGSIFQITLPVVEVSDILIKKSEFKPMITGFEGKVRHVLIIDDKTENRSVLVNLLRPLGFTITEACNGQEGLDKSNENQPDIVLTDLVMPVMDGFEFTRRFRKIAHFSQVPVIAVSASVFDYHQQQSIDAGCNIFLPKPIDADALLNTLQESLDLIWIYEVFNSAHVQNSPSVPSEVFEITTDYPLSIDDATQLHRLGLEGDVAAILDMAKQLRSNVELLPLLNKIEQLAKSFDSDGVSDLVQPYLISATTE